MHHQNVRLTELDELAVNLVTAQIAEPLGGFGFFAHGYPDVAVDDRAPRQGGRRLVGHQDASLGALPGGEDRREELVTFINGELRIHRTSIPATDRRVCLLQAPRRAAPGVAFSGAPRPALRAQRVLRDLSDGQPPVSA